MAKLKAGKIESHNHRAHNPPQTTVTAAMVMEQVARYNQIDKQGHLYGAIIASLRNYLENRQKGKYGEYHLAYCAHYVGDLSQPLHNTLKDAYNKKYHKRTDGIVESEVMQNLEKIKIYPVQINSEQDLATEIARIANRAKTLGYRLEAEDRLITREEAYQQLSDSASLFRAILHYVNSKPLLSTGKEF